MIFVDNPKSFLYYPEKLTDEYRSDFNGEKFQTVLLKLGFDTFTELRQQARMHASLETASYYNLKDYCKKDGKMKMKDKNPYKDEILSLIWNTFSRYDINQGYTAISRKDKTGKLREIRLGIELDEANLAKHAIPKIRLLKKFRNKNPNDFTAINYNEEVGIVRYCSNLFHNKTLALSEYPEMDVLAFDIDCHDGDEIHAERTLYYLLLEFGFPEVMFAEKSISGGYHVFFKIDKVVPDEFKKRLIECFLKKYEHEGFEIEVRLRTKHFRLPDSPSYMPCRIEIKDVEYIDVVPYSCRSDWYDRVLAFDASLPVQTLESFCVAVEAKYGAFRKAGVSPRSQDSGAVGPVRAPEPIKLKELSGKASEKLGIVNGGRSRNMKSLQHKLYHEYPIYAGNRIETMKSIASFCFKLKLGAVEFHEACLSNNVSSKDFAEWTEEQIKEECFQFYNHMVSLFILNGQPLPKVVYEEKFITNIQFVSGDLLRYCVDYADIFSNEELIPSMTSKKWQDETKRAFQLLVQEIVGYMIYDHYQDHKYNPKSGITFVKYSQIMKGFQFPRKMLSLMKKHYGIRVDIHKLFNALMNPDSRLGIFRQVMLSESGWCWDKKHPYSRIWKLVISSPSMRLIYGKSIEETILDNIQSVTSTFGQGASA